MEIKIYSFRYAKEILEHPTFSNIYNELIDICKMCPIPYYQGKSENQKKLCVIQQFMNNYFLYMFEKIYGWKKEVYATPDSTLDGLRSDFRKTFFISESEKITVQVEVEFGNAASSYRDYFKFQLSYLNELTDLCVLILPSKDLSNKIDSGLGSYEKTCREICSAKLSTTVPILVIGLYEDNITTIDLKQKSYYPELSEKEYLKVIKCQSNKYNEQHFNLIESYIKEYNINNRNT